MTKDEKASALIETEIRKGWPNIVRTVNVTPWTDFLDEPSLDVLVGLGTVRDVPESLARGEMLARLDAALQEIGDARTTHIGFTAPDEIREYEVEEDEPQGLGT